MSRLHRSKWASQALAVPPSSADRPRGHKLCALQRVPNRSNANPSRKDVSRMVTPCVQNLGQRRP
eukprot:12105468-Alexandrium_andersonii.AAC.1